MNKLIQITVITLTLLTLLSPLSISAAVSTWQQGASINATYTTDFSSSNFKQSIDNLAKTGANYVDLTIPYYQSNIYSTDIQRGNHTPTDQSLTEAVNYAHSKGLKVMFKIHMESYDGNWRANINPSDRETWFRNYENVLMHYARMAQSLGVEQYCIGAEMVSMTNSNINSSNTTYWNRMIANIRTAYSGLLTYSAQRSINPQTEPFEEQFSIKFWDKLDYIGLSGYYPIASYTNNPTKQQIINSWSEIEKTIYPVVQSYNKPLIFTEVGYRSLIGANQIPWDYNYQNTISQELQANLYDGLLEFWNTKDYVKGIHLWEWESNPNAGGWNTAYTPQNKLAEEVLKKWFGDNAPQPNPNPQPPSTIAITGSINPSQPVINQSAEVNINIKPNTAVSNSIVDIEIYNSNNQRVFQKFYENQNLNANTDNNFKTNFTPNALGNYTIKAGLFNNNWSVLYKWEGQVKDFTVVNQPVVNPKPQPPVNTSYTIQSSVSNNPLVNQAINISTNFTSNTNLNNVIIDIEVYNSSNQKVLQQFYEGQSLAANTAKTYNLNFNTPNTGEYTIRAGIFNNTWGNLYWNGDVKKFTVNNQPVVNPNPQPDPQPQPSSEIKILQSIESVNNGLNTFRTTIEGRAVNTYNMYWSVDGGQLNQMNNNGSNKEALVDVSGWWWKNNGPYVIKFTAKELNGAVISEKSVNMTIAR